MISGDGNDGTSRGERAPEDLDRPEGNSLVENYDLHDIGEETFIRRCEERGFMVERWGIDQRHDDGEDGLLYDDRLDYKVNVPISSVGAVESGTLGALVDVKTKSGPEWMGMFNARHYATYYEHRLDMGVPTFVIMFLVDEDNGTVLDEFVYEVTLDHKDGLLFSQDHDAIDVFPDGNHKAVVRHSHRKPWEHFIQRVVS